MAVRNNRRKSHKSDISYFNKDIVSKVFADNMKGRSLAAYGFDVPAVRRLLPTNLPEFSANELRLDNLFEFEDDTVAIVDYESKYRKNDKIKYINYLSRVLKRYMGENKNFRMLVIYTADVQREQVDAIYDVGCLKLETEMAFLSEKDTVSIFKRLERKVTNEETLSEEDVMDFIILPLTVIEDKESWIYKTIELAKKINDEKLQNFILSGIVVFADKVIEKSLSDEIRRWLGMTKVGKIICDEINEKVREEVEKCELKKKEELAKVTRETEIRCDVKALYEYKNLTIEQIAKEKNLSVDSVIEYLKASGIKIA